MTDGLVLHRRLPDDAIYPPVVPVVVDLGVTETRGLSGEVWRLAANGDVDAMLVHLEPFGATILQRHEVHVVLAVIAGRGRLTIDVCPHDLHTDVLAMIPKGARHDVGAGAGGLTFLAIRPGAGRAHPGTEIDHER